MARWKPQEIAILRRVLEENGGVLLREHLENLEPLLPGRSAAGIKKKYLEVKGQRNLPNNRQEQPEPTLKGTKWTEDEERRLAQCYQERNEPQSGARIKAIMDSFPGRTAKAMATKLREKYPQVYYMREINQQVDNPPIEPTQTHQSPTPGIATTTQTPPTPQHPLSESDEEEEVPEEATEVPEVIPERVEPPRLPYSNEMKKLSEMFDKMQKTTGKVKQKLKKFYLKPKHNPIVKAVDTILAHNIEDIQRSPKTDTAKRYAIKNAIYIAGKLLFQQIVGASKTYKKPAYQITERKIRKLEKHQMNAEKILKTRGKLSKTLLEEMHIIKKLKMTVRQYISSTVERLNVLKKTLQQQKARHGKQQLRNRFFNTPSIRVLEIPHNNPTTPEMADVETFYQNLFKKCQENLPTPIFNKWLSKMKRFANTQDTQTQIEEQGIKTKILKVLTRTAPWKAPGEDKIPTFLYKILPSAKDYLIKTTVALIQGSGKLTQADTRANITLIFKKGDAKDPANYRPIAVLNTDYKILTAVITDTIKENLPDWAIPTEQLARENVWGTTHGFLLDKSITQLARLRRATSYSSWYDFTKAYDSIHHKELKRLIDCLPLNRHIRHLLKQAMMLWAVRVKVGKKLTKEIPIKRGVYQGDSISPLLFKLVTAGLLSHIKNSPEITKASKGKQKIIAYMDDIKCHAPNKKAIELITEQLEQGAREIGLKLNRAKCGLYTREAANQEERDIAPFLPEIREGYRYLGLHQLERDTLENYGAIEEKIEGKISEITASELTTSQKITLINSTVNPAANYIMGNIYPDEKRSTTLKRCRDMDLKIRKKLVENNVKGKTTSNARVYMPVKKGGLGLRPIELEAEIQYIRKGVYLRMHKEMGSAFKSYKALKNAGWRNPISDFEYVMEKYQCQINIDDFEDYKKCCKEIINKIKTKYYQQLEEEWSANLLYAKIVVKEENIQFPAYQSPNMDSWRLRVLMAASEEQLHGLGSNPNTRRKCQKGCNVDENSYHVASACPTRAITTRHDFVVHWVLKTLLQCLGAPFETQRNLPFGRATVNCEFHNNHRTLKIEAGNKILTGKKLYHNKPDIVVTANNPDEIFVIEVAVAHLQNFRDQEQLKNTRYAINSVKKIDHKNFRNTQRDMNLVNELETIYRCPVKLGVFVIGCFGELLKTEAHNEFCDIMGRLGISKRELQTMLNKCSYSVAVSTSNILLRRIEDLRTEGQQQT